MKHLLLLAAVLSASAFAYDVETLQRTGDPSQRIAITVLGDGYTAADQAQLSSDARALVEQLFSNAPYSQYRALFDIDLVHVISQDRGAKNGAGGPAPSTALGASFGCNGIDRLLCVDNGSAKVIAAEATPQYDLLIVIVNDPTYGGSGGDVATVSRAPESGQILPHELGHTLAHLADEYSDPYPGYPACSSEDDCPEPNASIHTDRAHLKWSQWLDTDVSVPSPSPGGSEIGAFAGCRYESSGVFRPFDDSCMMRKLGHPFCAVCEEALIRAFWSKVSPIDSAAPGPTPIATACGPTTFSVQPAPAQTQFSYLWFIDGKPTRDDHPSLSIDANHLGAGLHQVMALVQDTTPEVRSDPKRLLAAEHTWLVQSEPGAPGTCMPGPCDENASCQSGACVATHKPAGSACVPVSCPSSAQIGVCDAAGGCHVLNPERCAIDACGPACFVQCADDAQCGDGERCEAGACRPMTPAAAVRASSCSTAAGAPFVLAALVSVLAARRRTQRRR